MTHTDTPQLVHRKTANANAISKGHAGLQGSFESRYNDEHDNGTSISLPNSSYNEAQINSSRVSTKQWSVSLSVCEHGSEFVLR
jgi:hypothetical protein